MAKFILSTNCTTALNFLIVKKRLGVHIDDVVNGFLIGMRSVDFLTDDGPEGGICITVDNFHFFLQ